MNQALNIDIKRFSRFENVAAECEIDDKTNLNNSKTTKDIQISFIRHKWAQTELLKDFQISEKQT